MLSTLSLANFRNHKELRLEELTSFIMLVGENGVGKTNVLESISLLAPGRGMRQVNFEEIAHNNNIDKAPGWSVYAETSDGLSLATGCGQEQGTRANQRIIKMAGKVIKTQADILTELRIIWFCPQLEDLCMAAMAVRRRYFDRLVYNFFINHANQISNYEKLVRTRQKILQENHGDERWLDGVENQLVEAMIAIASKRLHALQIISKAIDELKDDFLQPKLLLSGFVEDKISGCLAEDEIRLLIKNKLKHNRLLDKLSKRTNCGVHKSEFTLYNPQKQRPAAQCSTGEQKAMLLSLALAQAHALINFMQEHHNHDRVIILLDEMLSHLDDNRQMQLLKMLQTLKAQIWMTATTPPKLTKADKIQILRIAS